MTWYSRSPCAAAAARTKEFGTEMERVGYFEARLAGLSKALREGSKLPPRIGREPSLVYLCSRISCSRLITQFPGF